MKKYIGYLGPPGTFTEEALFKITTPDDNKLIEYSSIPDILFAIETGEIDEGIVPIENSIEGSVNVTLDIMIFQVSLLIKNEIILNVDHNLLAKKGIAFNEINRIFSHPHAVAQCRNFIKTNFDNIEIKAANSTAEAAKLVAASAAGNDAAISTKLAAELYGLEMLASGIQDYKDNLTRFVIVGKEFGKRSGFDKTSLVCFIYEDKPGSLLEILQEFAKRNINLTKIESRPTKKTLGEYCFLMDMEGHIEDAIVSEAIDVLKGKLRHIKMLGSFPRWRNTA